jgi:hypothetical protein
MSRLSRSATAVVVAAAAVVAVAAAPAVAATSPAAAPGWSGIPAAARGPVRAAVDRASAASPNATVETADLTASDGANGDSLGYSVAMSGNTIVVGAPFHEVGGELYEGALYVFTEPKTGWASVGEPATLTVAGQEDQGIGRSVAIDGNTIVAGVPGGDGEGGAGGVYVFTKPATGWTTSSHPAVELSARVPDIAGSDALGWSVAISGNTIVAGAPYHSTSFSNPNDGIAYLYVEPTAGWSHATTETATLAPDDPAADSGDFGVAVAVDGSTVVVGSREQASGSNGSAYVFTKPAGGWTDTTPTHQTTELSASGAASLGAAVAVHAKTVVVGAPEPGAAYVYNEPATGWPLTMPPSDTLTSSILAGAGSTGDFGGSLAFNGGTIAVGGPTASGLGAAHEAAGTVSVFKEPAGGWTGAQHQISTLVCRHPTGQLGASVAIAGATIVAGAPGNVTGHTSAGAAFVYPPRAAPTKPTLSKVTETHKSWKAGKALPRLNPKKAPKGGTAFGFTLSQPATVSLSFATRKGAHKGSLSEHAREGANYLFFDGRLTRHKKLKAGRYVVTVTAKNAAGRSAAKKLAFKIT